MREIEVRCADGASPATVEAACKQLGLTMRSRGTLKRYPGSTHWHYRYGAFSGTLEITWWPDRGRLWFKIHTMRSADWMDELIPLLIAALEPKC